MEEANLWARDESNAMRGESGRRGRGQRKESSSDGCFPVPRIPGFYKSRT